MLTVCVQRFLLNPAFVAAGNSSAEVIYSRLHLFLLLHLRQEPHRSKWQCDSQPVVRTATRLQWWQCYGGLQQH